MLLTECYSSLVGYNTNGATLTNLSVYGPKCLSRFHMLAYKLSPSGLICCGGGSDGESGLDLLRDEGGKSDESSRYRSAITAGSPCGCSAAYSPSAYLTLPKHLFISGGDISFAPSKKKKYGQGGARQRSVLTGSGKEEGLRHSLRRDKDSLKVLTELPRSQSMKVLALLVGSLVKSELNLVALLSFLASRKHTSSVRCVILLCFFALD
ncbi:hypothetical protein Tco_0281079 [Tanacetum coccineum]